MRAVRLVRLCLHFLAGLATVLFLFPAWSQARRRHAILRWSRRLLEVAGLKLHYQDLPDPFPSRCLLVLNHISWLDIFLVDAVHPAMFVAKSEISRWPLAGTLVTRAGTLYIEKGSRKAAHRANDRIAAALTAGSLVACFPEGTTSEGDGVGRFHGALFQPAIDAQAMIQPVALRYTDRHGRRSKACGYVGEESLMESVWKIVSARSLVGEMRFLPVIDATGANRRVLAQQAQAAIEGSLTR